MIPQTSAVTLLALDLACPKCGTRPNIRIVPELTVLVRHADPDLVLGTWGCQGRQCSEKVLITARMIQHATEPSLTRGRAAV